MTKEEAIQRFQRMKKILAIPNSDAERTAVAIDMAIEALQTDVVRCGKCKKQFTNDCYMIYGKNMMRNLFDNDFCSYGERREK